MAAQKVDFVFVNAIDLADPAIVQAARLLEKEGVVKVIPVGAGQERPTTSQLLIVKKEFMERAATYRALELLLENQPNVILRADNERPTMSEAYAKTRGFTDAEIETELKPWIQQGRAAARAEVERAAKALEAAKAEEAAQ